ncbi:hypothetical protein CKO09_04065 [Chromatium weissei]|nr:hypothetical protein [Chromatium weissei]
MINCSSKLTLLLICVLNSAPTLAHRLQVFASAEGANISGSAYFAGGAKASGVRIEIQNAVGQLLAELITAADGSFNYSTQSPIDHLIIADSGDGHRAQWRITAAELGGNSLPNASTASPSVSTAPANAVDSATLAAIELAVARQVRPLREELQAAENHANFRDILGGIGYIVGVTGILLWWRQRHNSPRS